MRDKGDDIAKIALSYAESENINKSLVIGLESFAECFSTVSDYGDLRVQTLDMKVVGEFGKYENICKNAKEEVREIYSARDKEISRRKQLDKIREKNPRNRQQIVQAETELVKATAEMSKSVHNLEEKTNKFEKQKLHDVKSILLDFIATELGYHAKTLEILTKAYNEVYSINEEADLQEFKKSLHLPESLPHESTGKSSLLRSVGSLGSLGLIFSSTNNKRNARVPNSKEKLSKSEETLDSIKHSFTESEQSETDTEESTSSSDDNKSPIVVRNFKK